LVWVVAVAATTLAASAATAQLKTGTKAPDVGLTNLQGKKVKLSQLRGNSPALVNFFATW
jgi:hypothetical protein